MRSPAVKAVKRAALKIYIGVGELQESSVETPLTTGQKPTTGPGIVRGGSGNAKPNRKGNVETTWKVEKGEK